MIQGCQLQTFLIVLEANDSVRKATLEFLSSICYCIAEDSLLPARLHKREFLDGQVEIKTDPQSLLQKHELNLNIPIKDQVISGIEKRCQMIGTSRRFQNKLFKSYSIFTSKSSNSIDI